MVGVELYYFSNILSFQGGFVIYYVKEVLWFNLRIFMISVLVLWYLLWNCNNFYRIVISVISDMVCDICYGLWHLIRFVTFVMVCGICYGLWYLLWFVIFVIICDICYDFWYLLYGSWDIYGLNRIIEWFKRLFLYFFLSLILTWQ